MEKLIIDTDIGSDIDDAFALTFAIRAGMQIPLITTVHGDTQKRARIAKKLVDLLEKEIPIVAGESKPIKQKHIFWYGHEGNGLIEDSEALSKLKFKDNALDTIAQIVYSNAGNISIAAIGPLTNIAKSFEKYPDLAGKINNIYLMGGILIRPAELIQTYRAHNFKVDPEAYDIVFNSEVNKIFITTEVAKKTYLTKDDLSLFEKKTTDKVLHFLARGAIHWLKESSYDVAYLYDPLTLAHHINLDLTERLKNGKTSVTLDLKENFKKVFLDKIGVEHGY